VIVLYPSAFTKSKDTIDAAVRGYKEINLRALRMLRPPAFCLSFGKPHSHHAHPLS
jgi:23S rRNA (cytosine1962-C5)-methyltransferase